MLQRNKSVKTKKDQTFFCWFKTRGPFLSPVQRVPEMTSVSSPERIAVQPPPLPSPLSSVPPPHPYQGLTNCRIWITVCGLLNFDIIKWQLEACVASVFVVVTHARWPYCKQFTCPVTASLYIMNRGMTLSAIKRHWTVI